MCFDSLVFIVKASHCLPSTATPSQPNKPCSYKAWHQPPRTALPHATLASSLSHPFNTVPRPGRAFRGFVQRKRREREQDSADVIPRYGASPARLCFARVLVSEPGYWLQLHCHSFTAMSNLTKPESQNVKLEGARTSAAPIRTKKGSAYWLPCYSAPMWAKFVLPVTVNWIFIPWQNWKDQLEWYSVERRPPPRPNNPTHDCLALIAEV